MGNPNSTTPFSEMDIDNKNPPTLSNDQTTVHNHIFSFYNSLFSHKPCNDNFSDLQNFMDGIDLDKITQEENTALERPITKLEIANFIKSMSNDKAPGITGITPAFYKVFWSQISDLVTEAINNCLNNNSFPPRQKVGLITLIPKQDKYPKYITNLRPITLLPTFYKITSGVLTARLKPIFDRLISPWQKAYLPNRFIGDITRNTFDLLQHAKSNNLPGLMLQIEFSKAFDSISFEFIENTLKLFNLNPKYISWINTLLKNFQSSIMINGFPTPRIRVGRGCRQGDPIAGYLFIICVELLLLKLQSCKQIQPWQTITNQLKLLDAYADDINLFLAYNHPTQQLNHILRVLDDFKKLSGLATNVSKTKYALFGNAPDDLQITPTTSFSIEPAPFRLLGITLTGDLNHLDINWTKAIKAVRFEIFQWSTMRLTTTAKVNIIKTCLLSKFTHLATALPLPHKKVISEVEKIFTRFINGKRNQFSKQIIFTPKRFGGLGVPDLKTFWSSLQCSWLSRLHTSAELWAKILLTNKTPTPMAFLTQNLETLSPRMSNPFWTQVLERWKAIRPKLYHNQDDLIHTNICNSTKTSFTILIPPYKYIPLSLIVDHDLNILPPSELEHRIPLTDWEEIKPLTIFMATSNLRHKINKSSLTGNFEPFYPPELRITNPNLKGCKLFFNALSDHSFESKHWAKFNQFQADHEIAPEILEKQIIKLSNTPRAIEAKDLQYRVLRNTCITNNKTTQPHNHTPTHTNTHTHTHTHTPTYTHTQTHKHTHTDTHTHTHTRRHTNTRTPVHTLTHRHIHT